jgi:hypothetical protein
MIGKSGVKSRKKKKNAEDLNPEKFFPKHAKVSENGRRLNYDISMLSSVVVVVGVTVVAADVLKPSISLRRSSISFS